MFYINVDIFFKNRVFNERATAYLNGVRVLSIRPAAAHPDTGVPMYALALDAGEGSAHLTVPATTSLTFRFVTDTNPEPLS